MARCTPAVIFDSLSLRITAYLRLVVLAAAFQHGLKRGLSRRSEVFVKAFEAAKMVISIMVERLYPTSHLRYAMEANFLYVAYAAAFLTNVSVMFHSFYNLLFDRLSSSYYVLNFSRS